jgi:predicted TPR repeat methyltransferase
VSASPSDPAAFERAKARFLEGLRCQQEGRLDEAVTHYLASLAAVPGRASTLTNLAAARLELGEPAQALDDARAALAAEPDNREALRHEATALAELGRIDEALRSFRRFVALEPRHPGAWMAIGNLLMEQHDNTAAARAFEAAIDAGADAELARFHLAAARGEASQRATGAPPAPPRAYVESLFDRYAHDFDRHLVGRLGYSAPQELVQALPPGEPLDISGQALARLGNALDLGCGTGLCAPLLRPRVDRLVGVDLSARMLEQARALGLYDRLDHADIATWLAACDERFDLVIAADVFIYVGALDAVFAGVARVLRAGGLFAFSLESAQGDASAQGYVLQRSKRYAHTLAYVGALSQHHDMQVSRAHAGTVRREQEGAVEGTYVIVIKP